MKIHVSELEGRALDFCIAQIDSHCEGISWKLSEDGIMIGYGDVEGDSVPCVYLSCGSTIRDRFKMVSESIERYSPSHRWEDGGRLVQEHCTALNKNTDGSWWCHSGRHIGEGPEPLISACRAIVAAKLGEEVEIPDELVG